jgi:hypothetical protein
MPDGVESRSAEWMRQDTVDLAKGSVLAQGAVLILVSLASLCADEMLVGRLPETVGSPVPYSVPR